MQKPTPEEPISGSKKDTKNSKFLDQILLEDQDEVEEEKDKMNKLYKIIQDLGQNNQDTT